MTGLRGALATMERKLHNLRLNELVLNLNAENYGADAPPWRGRHGAQWLSLNHNFATSSLFLPDGFH